MGAGIYGEYSNNTHSCIKTLSLWPSSCLRYGIIMCQLSKNVAEKGTTYSIVVAVSDYILWLGQVKWYYNIQHFPNEDHLRTTMQYDIITRKLRCILSADHIITKSWISHFVKVQLDYLSKRKMVSVDVGWMGVEPSSFETYSVRTEIEKNVDRVSH